jgi:hypothetical protein
MVKGQEPCQVEGLAQAATHLFLATVAPKLPQCSVLPTLCLGGAYLSQTSRILRHIANSCRLPVPGIGRSCVAAGRLRTAWVTEPDAFAASWLHRLAVRCRCRPPEACQFVPGEAILLTTVADPPLVSARSISVSIAQQSEHSSIR